MATQSIFPVYTKLEHQNDGSAAASFVADVEDLVNKSNRRLSSFADEAQRNLKSALTMPLTADGSLNLGVESLRRMAQEQDRVAAAAQELANAQMAAAQASGVFDQETRQAISAAKALAVSEEQAAQSKWANVRATEMLQAELNRNESALTNVTGATRNHIIANDNAAVSTNAMRHGMQNLGYQLSDISTMWAMGARPQQIFASQSGQVVQALQMMTGGASQLGTFLTGPWGIALTTATLALTPLIGKLFEADSALAGVESRAKSAIGALQGLAKEGIDQQIAMASGELARLQAEEMRLEEKLASPRAAMSHGIHRRNLFAVRQEILAVQNAINQGNRALREQAERAAEKPATTPATRTSVSGGTRVAQLSELERAWQQANREAKRFISTLEREIATIGKSPGELRQMEIARAKDAAATDAQRQRIEELNAAREEALTIQARNEAVLQDAKATAEFRNATIRPLEDELALLGLIGPARAKAALALEEEAFKADLLAKGIIDVNARWQEYLQLRTRIIDGESALDQERQSAALLAHELDRVVSALGNIGGVGSTIGGLLGILGGASLSGPLGALLGTRIGTDVNEQGDIIARTLGDELRDVFGSGGEFSQAMTTALQGAGLGTLAGSALFGQQSAIGQLSSALGGAAGQAAGEAFTKGLGGLLGSAGGPVGAIFGGLAGGLFGSLFGGSQRGSAILTGSSITSYYGDSSSRKGAAGDLGGSVLDAIDRIAQQLGAHVNAAAGRVSIGIRDDAYYVDPQGRGYTKSSRYPDIMGFGQDAEAAVRAATMNLIQDGVITGLRASTQRLLRTGKDIEAALNDALAFENVFTRLEAHLDPVGSAINQIDTEFTRLQDMFKRAGASTSEWADLEELYWLERDKIVREATERHLGGLRGLLTDLTVGNSALSLRDRRDAAMAEYDPLAQRVAAGDVDAYDDFANAARALLEIERQISGSQSGYFDLRDQVEGLTQGAIDRGTGALSQAIERDSPFGSRPLAVDNAGVTSAIDMLRSELASGTNGHLAAVNENLGWVIGLLSQNRSPFDYGAPGSW